MGRGSSIMIPQVVTNETITVISPNGINFPQTDKPQPSHQWQDSLKKHLKAEIKVMAAIQIMCAVMVLVLGIILASVPSVPHFTSVFSVLLKSGYPFVGALFFIVSGILSIITDTKSTKTLGVFSLMLISTLLELGLAVLTAMLWWEQSHSYFPGNVIFLPHNSNNESNMESKALCNPAYEEQLVC
ncbi:membrane-spanning 4-domains subfamily A member 6B-like isoform X2 [Mastomys coucha]|uniref:membrane-spanning 4-domains subfamily A member 6B-like isoform X2 n=1 Tax=Mastomys coucha TaxID=35658 RepID=UPI0012618754|nr:membrane-spanning 4-domains subfamily A member 6B-like isoform X2 [Mastomys coucha]